MSGGLPLLLVGVGGKRLGVEEGGGCRGVAAHILRNVIGGTPAVVAAFPALGFDSTKYLACDSSIDASPRVVSLTPVAAPSPPSSGLFSAALAGIGSVAGWASV